MLSNCFYCKKATSVRSCPYDPSYYQVFLSIKSLGELSSRYTELASPCEGFSELEFARVELVLDEQSVKLLLAGVITPEVKGILSDSFKNSVSLTEIHSSNISGSKYNEATGDLYVEFKAKEGSPTLYKYSDVAPSTYDDFMNASSQGSFFHAVIKKDGYSYERIS